MMLLDFGNLNIPGANRQQAKMANRDIREPLIYSYMVATVAWHRSLGYDLCRARRDLPDLTRNATHGGVNQWFLGYIANNPDQISTVGTGG